MKLKLTSFAIAIVVLTCLVIDMGFKNWRKEERVVEHDVHWYYGYLPAQFIYDDIRLAKSDYRYGDNHYFFWTVTTSEGKRVIKSTMGLAILYAPFFFMAHMYAMLSDYPENGFSEPYKIFLLLSAIFYLLVGLDFLKKILNHYKFSDANIAITILLLGLGTNLLCYSSQSATMPHVYIFCLFSLFIFYTIKWYQNQSKKNAIILGVLFGLISLTRPSNVIILLFFLLFEVSDWTELKQRIDFIIKKPFIHISMIFIAVLIWVPQFFYWKIVTGHYISYSYTDEGFYFLHPKIIQGLFSFRKGWLVYTPMMLFAIAGIFFLKNELKKIRLPIVLFFILNIYIILSWWCWWYGGTYGQRSFIDSYALMAIPLASFVKYVSEKRWYYNLLFYSITLFFVWLNIFQTYQFEYFSLHWDAMTKQLYFKQFGKLDKIKDFDNYLSYPDYEQARHGVKSYLNNHHEAGENKADRKLIHLKAANGKFVCADQHKNNKLIAESENNWEWETFEIIYLDKTKINLKASTGKFVCADRSMQDTVIANRDEAGEWETFTLIKLDSISVAFKTGNGKYLSQNETSLQLIATTDSIGVNEKFILISK